MNQPKPSLSKKTRILSLPRRDGFMIPNNSLSMGMGADYKVPACIHIEDIYRPLSSIVKFRPAHPYDYDFYVSGGMTGHKNHNFDMFDTVSNCVLREHGFRVFNPAENFGGRSDLSRSTYMRKDQSSLTRCGNILLLPSFKESEGATGEVNNALSLPDMGIFLFIKPMKDTGQPIIIKAKR